MEDTLSIGERILTFPGGYLCDKSIASLKTNSRKLATRKEWLENLFLDNIHNPALKLIKLVEMPLGIKARLLGGRLYAIGISYWPPNTREAMSSAGGAFCDPHSQIFLFRLVLETQLLPLQLSPFLVLPGRLLACFVVTGDTGTCVFARRPNFLIAQAK